MEMSSGVTLGYFCPTKVLCIHEAPASSRTLEVLGEVHVTWESVLGQKRNPFCASCATKSPRPMKSSDWTSTNALILFFADACHVSRPPRLVSSSFRVDGLERSGV
jgi:hypothetical protein